MDVRLLDAAEPLKPFVLNSVVEEAQRPCLRSGISLCRLRRGGAGVTGSARVVRTVDFQVTVQVRVGPKGEIARLICVAIHDELEGEFNIPFIRVAFGTVASMAPLVDRNRETKYRKSSTTVSPAKRGALWDAIRRSAKEEPKFGVLSVVRLYTPSN